MYLKTGSLTKMSAKKRVIVPAAGGGASTFTGFKIKVSGAITWVATYEWEITDHDDNTFIVGLTHKNETVTTFAGLADDETCTNSTYSSLESYPNMMTNVLPNIANSSSTIGGVQWNDSSGATQWFYAKVATARSIKHLDIAFDTETYNAQWDKITVYDQDDNVLTPTTSPANATDYYQTTGTAAVNWYRWTFPENP